MYNQQNGANPVFDRNCSHRVPSLLAALVHAVQSDEATPVFKDKGCELE